MFLISGKIIIENAKFFHAELSINSECRYSSGWLEKFKKRHRIRKLKATGEKKCGEYVSATMFVDDLKEYVYSEEKLTSERIYNADETMEIFASIFHCGIQRV